jgi:hypothetical protein
MARRLQEPGHDAVTRHHGNHTTLELSSPTGPHCFSVGTTGVAGSGNFKLVPTSGIG